MIRALRRTVDDLVEYLDKLQVSGELRELLENVKRARVIDRRDMATPPPPPPAVFPEGQLPELAFDAYERACVERALEECEGSATHAARILRVGKSSMYRYIAKYNLQNHGRPS